MVGIDMGFRTVEELDRMLACAFGRARPDEVFLPNERTAELGIDITAAPVGSICRLRSGREPEFYVQEEGSE